MGGNALAPYGARRVDRKTAFDSAEKVVEAMKDIAQKYKLHLDMCLVPAYRTKEDFGDLDFVIDSRLLHGIDRATLIVELARCFGAEVPAHNGGSVLSFGFPLGDGTYLQVDLIWTLEKDMATSVAYFAWNDLGNLIGRIAHKFGLKYGHDGLWIVLRDDTHQFGKILITRDIPTIMKFLGYDYVRWAAGFNTREDIYRFTASSPFFNKSIYELDNRNHTARVRERKRLVYMDFLEWLKNPPFELPEYEFFKDKSLNLPRLFEAFPDVKEQYERMWTELQESKYLKTRFNALVVTEVTGRTRESLGVFMKHFKENHMHELADIRNMTDADVRQLISRVNEKLVE